MISWSSWHSNSEHWTNISVSCSICYLNGYRITSLLLAHCHDCCYYIYLLCIILCYLIWLAELMESRKNMTYKKIGTNLWVRPDLVFRPLPFPPWLSRLWGRCTLAHLEDPPVRARPRRPFLQSDPESPGIRKFWNSSALVWFCRGSWWQS